MIANARRYRNELRARADLEALINTSPVGVIVFDAQTGVPLSINRESRRIIGNMCKPGTSEEELFDTVTFQRADGNQISLAEFPLSQAFKTGETVRAEEMVIQGPEWGQVVTLVNATPIYTDSGETDSVIVTLLDMTPLEEQARLRAEFLGMVSHELNAPLAAISGTAVTMRNRFSEADPAEILRFCRLTEKEAGHMRGLISDLLDAVHIETDTLTVIPEPVDAAVLLDRARSIFLHGGGLNDIHIDLP